MRSIINIIIVSLALTASAQTVTSSSTLYGKTNVTGGGGIVIGPVGGGRAGDMSIIGSMSNLNSVGRDGIAIG